MPCTRHAWAAESPTTTRAALPANQFGEGVALHGDRLYQLTWQNGLVHVYDRTLQHKTDGTCGEPRIP